MKLNTQNVKNTTDLGNHATPVNTGVAWKSIANDDFFFRFGDYFLRVEQMNKRYWWWCVYYKNDYAGFGEPKAKTELEAKYLAESCFFHHFLSLNRKLMLAEVPQLDKTAVSISFILNVEKLTKDILKYFPKFFNNFTNFEYGNGVDAGEDFKKIFYKAKKLNKAVFKNYR